MPSKLHRKPILAHGHPAFAWVLLAASSLGLTACGEPEPAAAGTGPAVVLPADLRSKQEPLTPADWQKELSADAALQQLATAAGGTLQAAGVVEAVGGQRLVWGEFAADAQAPREQVKAVFRACKKADDKGQQTCVRGAASHTAAGVQVQEAGGATLAQVDIGAPVLLKYLKFHNLDTDPTLLAGLERAYVVDTGVAQQQLQRLGEWNKRRFILLNAYGPQAFADPTEIRAAAQKTGLYDEVREVSFVRRGDVDAILPSLTPLDTVVWLGAGVQEKFTDKAYKSIGMTVSRGVFGDELYHRKMLDKLLSAPPLGGPGLIVLAGSQSLSLTYLNDATSSFGTKLALAPVRPVVGFEGKVTWLQANLAVATLIGELGAGKALGAAMTAAAAGLEKPLLTTLAAKVRDTWVLPKNAAAFWGSKPPALVALTVRVGIVPKCVAKADNCDSAGFTAAAQVPGNLLDPNGKNIVEGTAVFDCNVTFQGPYFSCTAKSAVHGSDFSVKGVMLGRELGDRFYVYLEGTPNPQYGPLTIIGEGELEKPEVTGGTTILRFKGIAAAAPYLHQDGYCCLAKAPLLQSIKGEPGFFKLTHGSL